MEDNIFPELCIMNAKKTYSKPFKKQLRTATESNNAQKTYRPAEKALDPGVPLTTKVAVEYLLNGKLKSNVCRYCLKVSPVLSELDQIMQIAGTGVMYKVSIRQMIACFYPFKVGQDQNFPEKICQWCLDKALNAYLFTQQCEQAERALHNCFDDMDEKLGKLDPIDRPKKRGRQKLNPNYNTLYAEHENVMDYAEPLQNIINIQTESLSKEPDWNEFECKKCWQVLPNLESLLNHEKTHPKYMWYHCRLCGKSFLKHNQLKKHFNQVHVRGKETNAEVDKTFKCKECGNVTENYVQHLQHIEKHKFKSVMKHLIEKKTDQLCLVCLKESTDLVELDKMVCIHGSCPELVGDKTLYTVLASTLPDPKSYKYRELYVPQQASIMTITKRKRKYKEIEKTESDIQYDLALPKIITKDKFKTVDFFHYVFGEPQPNAMVDTETPRVVEITDEELKDCSKECILDDKILTDGNSINVLEDDSNTTNDNEMDAILIDKKKSTDLDIFRNFDNTNKDHDTIMESISNFLNTKYVDKTNQGIDYFKSIKEITIPKYDVTSKNNKSDVSWIFTKTADKYKPKDYKLMENIKDIIDKPRVKENACKFCWVFKDNICEYCKKTDYKAEKIIKEENNILIEDNLSKNNVEMQTLEMSRDDYKDILKDNLTKNHVGTQSKQLPKENNKDINENNVEKQIDISPYDKNVTYSKPGQTKIHAKKQKMDDTWQCKICLVNNYNNRSTCHCCESKKYLENGNCKIIFTNNNTFYEMAHRKDNKDEINIDKEVVLPNIEVIPSHEIEEATIMDTKSVDMENNFQIYIENTKERTTTQSMDIEMDSVNLLDTNIALNEEMDFKEYATIPNTTPKSLSPIKLAANIVPNIGTNIMSNIGTIDTNIMPNIGSNILPNIDTNIMPNIGSNIQPNIDTTIVPSIVTNIQFNIGSQQVKHDKGGRKFKRAVRNIPKASHK